MSTQRNANQLYTASLSHSLRLHIRGSSECDRRGSHRFITLAEVYLERITVATVPTLMLRYFPATTLRLETEITRFHRILLIRCAHPRVYLFSLHVARRPRVPSHLSRGRSVNGLFVNLRRSWLCIGLRCRNTGTERLFLTI